MKAAFFTIRLKKGFGVDLVVDRLARALAGTGCRVVVYCFEYEPDAYDDPPYEVATLHLTRDRLNRFLPFFEADALSTLRTIADGIPDGEGFDVTLPASFPFYGAGRIFECPSIHLDFGNPPTTGLTLPTRINRLYLNVSEKRHMARNERIVTISNFLKRRLDGKIHQKTEVVEPGCDHLDRPDKANVEALKRDLHARGDEFVMLSVSRLDFKSHPYKGVMELANLARRLREKNERIRLVLAGVGQDASVAALREMGAKVFLAPDSRTLSALYHASDVYVTLSRWEGFGLPVVEAARAGLPTIALNTTAHRETAVSCPASSIEDAGAWIEKLLLDENVRKTYGESARKLSSRFTWEKAGQRLVTIVNEVIGKSR